VTTVESEQTLVSHLDGCREETLRLARVLIADERWRVAMDLHDSVSAELTGTVLALAAAERRTESGPARATLAEARRAVQRAVRKVRDYAQTLQGAERSRGGVRDRLEAVAEWIRRAGAQAVLRISAGAAERLPPEAIDPLLGVVNEAAANALLHGRAGTVTIALRTRGRAVVIEVRDDGTGFDPHAARSGMGLANMHRRATAAGGRLTVRSAPDVGARVRLAVPVR
jgi:signal transduction histidine kinase